MVAPAEPRPNFIALLLSACPGLGHLLIGRARRGWYFFFAATFFLNLGALSFVSPVPPLGSWSLRLGLGIGAAIVVFSIIDVLRLAVLRRLPRVARRRREAISEALGLMETGNLGPARELLDSLLDLDPCDPEARCHLAALERRAGRMESAIHHARKALRASPDRRFRDALLRELDLAREGSRA